MYVSVCVKTLWFDINCYLSGIWPGFEQNQLYLSCGLVIIMAAVYG